MTTAKDLRDDADRSSATTVLFKALGWSSGGLASAAHEIVARAFVAAARPTP